jgi:hypothetical protein
MQRFPNRSIPNVHLCMLCSISEITNPLTWLVLSELKTLKRLFWSVGARPGTSTRRLPLEHKSTGKYDLENTKSTKIVSVSCPKNLPRRRRFCEWVLAKINVQCNFLSIVLTIDEAGFSREGIFYMHNTHICTEILTLLGNAIFTTNFRLMFN